MNCGWMFNTNVERIMIGMTQKPGLSKVIKGTMDLSTSILFSPSKFVLIGRIHLSTKHSNLSTNYLQGTK